MLGDPDTARKSDEPGVMATGVNRRSNHPLAPAPSVIVSLDDCRSTGEFEPKLRIFQQSGYLSLDLGAGNGEFFRLRGDVDVAALAMAPLALEQFVERIPLEAAEGDALRLEFESFLAAVRGESPVPVTGEAGREALAVALRIVADIEHGLPALAGGATLRARA